MLARLQIALSCLDLSTISLSKEYKMNMKAKVNVRLKSQSVLVWCCFYRKDLVRPLCLFILFLSLFLVATSTQCTSMFRLHHIQEVGLWVGLVVVVVVVVVVGGRLPLVF